MRAEVRRGDAKSEFLKEIKQSSSVSDCVSSSSSNGDDC